MDPADGSVSCPRGQQHVHEVSPIALRIQTCGDTLGLILTCSDSQMFVRLGVEIVPERTFDATLAHDFFLER